MSPLQHGAAVDVPGRIGGGDVVKVTWKGVDKFSRWLNDTPGIVVKDVEAALYQEGENIMGVSVRRTPVGTTGNLKNSGHVKLPETKGGKTTVVLAYGTDYAIYVHEIARYVHPVGQYKYLESAVKEAASGFGGRMKRRVLDRIGRRI